MSRCQVFMRLLQCFVIDSICRRNFHCKFANVHTVAFSEKCATRRTRHEVIICSRCWLSFGRGVIGNRDADIGTSGMVHLCGNRCSSLYDLAVKSDTKAPHLAYALAQTKLLYRSGRCSGMATAVMNGRLRVRVPADGQLHPG